ncbi:MAG: hypothetical protein RIS08_144 [Actinomycetota bacterium]|jgi:hypothetical protein
MKYEGPETWHYFCEAGTLAWSSTQPQRQACSRYCLRVQPQSMYLVWGKFDVWSANLWGGCTTMFAKVADLPLVQDWLD